MELHKLVAEIWRVFLVQYTADIVKYNNMELWLLSKLIKLTIFKLLYSIATEVN